MKLSGRIQTKKDQDKKIGLGVAGRLKIGKKVIKNGKEYPTSLDHFILDAPEDYVKAFKAAYGDKPDKIEIIFLSDDPAHSCSEQLQVRDKQGKLYAKSDGVNVLLAAEEGWTDVHHDRIEKNGGALEFMHKTAEHKGSSGVEHVLTLRFMIVRMKGVFAEFLLSTKGKQSSIKELTSAFDTLIDIAGTARMITFDLMVEMVKSDRSGSKNKYPVLRLIPNIGQENINRLREMVESGQNIARLGPISDKTFDEIDSKDGDILLIENPE